MLFDLGRLRIEFIGLEDWDVKITKNPNNQDELTLEASRKTPASFKVVAARPNGKFPSTIKTSGATKLFIQTRETFTRKGMRVDVSCESEDNKSFIRYSNRKDIVIQILSEPSLLPERNPLHGGALNIDDLKIGMKIHSCSTQSDYQDFSAIILSEPFQQCSKYQPEQECPSYLHDRLMITVVTTDPHGELILADLDLCNLGVVPYENGTIKSWHSKCYVLSDE